MTDYERLSLHLHLHAAHTLHLLTAAVLTPLLATEKRTDLTVKHNQALASFADIITACQAAGVVPSTVSGS